jgi:hypothetical protein
MDKEWHLFGVIWFGAIIVGLFVGLSLGLEPASKFIAAALSPWAEPSKSQTVAFFALLFFGVWLIGIAWKVMARALNWPRENSN